MLYFIFANNFSRIFYTANIFILLTLDAVTVVAPHQHRTERNGEKPNPHRHVDALLHRSLPPVWTTNTKIPLHCYCCQGDNGHGVRNLDGCALESTQQITEYPPVKDELRSVEQREENEKSVGDGEIGEKYVDDSFQFFVATHGDYYEQVTRQTDYEDNCVVDH